VLQRILVPLDGSPLAERALHLATALAQASGGELILLRAPELEGMLVPSAEAIGGYGLWWPDQALDLSEQETVDYLQQMAGRLSPQVPGLRTLVASGDPASAIVAGAAREDVQLITMSTHGHSGLSRWVLGSVTEKVLRSAPCPVAVCRGECPIRRILVTVDGSALSESAIQPALGLARLLGAKVTMLHAAGITRPEIEGLEGLRSPTGVAPEGRLAQSRQYLDSLAGQYQDADVPIDSVLTDLPAAEHIIDYAVCHEIDMIAMATHGRSGILRWVYGSVTEKVLRAASCSLLIVPATAG